MDWSQVEYDWQQFKPVVKRRWERLSDNELKLVNGKRDELCAKIQQAYGVSRQEADRQIINWLNAQSQMAHSAQQ
jgi:uncharacterized protein YjbJ (UPF0337 family)